MNESRSSLDSNALEDEVFRLTEECLRGEADEVEQLRLATLLSENSSARSLYLEYVAHSSILASYATPSIIPGDENIPWNSSDLYETASGTEISGGADSSEMKKSGLWNQVQFVSRAAVFPWAVAALLLGILLLIAVILPLPQNSDDKFARDAKDTPSENVAQLTDWKQVIWQEWNQVHGWKPRLAVGRKLELASGLAEITFDSGARVVLEGPAEFTLKGANSGYLGAGRLVARIGRDTKAGFIVDTPDARVTDIGTEFGVFVAASGPLRVEVFEGNVILSPPGVEYEIAESKVKVDAGSPLSVTTTDNKVVTHESTASRFTRKLSDAPLLRTLLPTQDTRIHAGGLDRANDETLSVHTIDKNVQQTLIQFDVQTLPTGYRVERADLVFYCRNNPNFPLPGENGACLRLKFIALHYRGVKGSQRGKLQSVDNCERSKACAAVGTTGQSMQQPYAKAVVHAAHLEAFHFDVTDLVIQWREGNVPNHGMLLRSFEGNNLSFFSKEYKDRRVHPRLIVKLTPVGQQERSESDSQEFQNQTDKIKE